MNVNCGKSSHVGNGTQACLHCGHYHVGACPFVKAIEYHENGELKRVEYIPRLVADIPNES